MSTTKVLMLVLVGWAILAFLSLAGANLSPPAAWLDAWTTWIATVVAIVISARVLWSGATALRNLGGRRDATSNSTRG